MMTNVITDIKERLDLVAIVEESGVRLRRVGRAFQGFCPFHDNTRTPAFTVYPDTQSYYCFGCQASGTVFDYVMQQRGMDFKQALEHLAPRAGVNLADPRPQQRREHDRQREKLLEITTLAARYFHYLLVQHRRGQPGRDYVAQRGVDDQTLEVFQVGYALEDWGHLLLYLTGKKGYAPEEVEAAGLIVKSERGGYYDRFRGRLIFPIRNDRGEVVGFGGRVIGAGGEEPRTPKYLNTPQTVLFDKSRVLYGLDQAGAAIRATDNVVIVEGYLDVVTAHQYGFRNVVAPLGTALTGGHVRLLKRQSRNLTFALDADAAGQRAVLKGIQTVQEGEDEDSRPVVSAQGLVRWERDVHVRVVQLPAGRDPDDLIRADAQQWRELTASAVPVMDFYLARFTAGLDMRHPTHQREAVEALVPLLARLPGEQQRIYATQMERVIGLRAEHILDMAQGAGMNGRGGRQAPSVLPARPVRSATPETWEETLLALLLRYPSAVAAAEGVLAQGLEDSPQVRELLGVEVGVLFERVEHRLIWQAAQGGGEPSAPLASPDTWLPALDAPLHGEVERLLGLTLPSDAEQRYAEMVAACVRRLRGQQARRWRGRLAEQMDAQEAEPGAEQLGLLQALVQYGVGLKGGYGAA